MEPATSADSASASKYRIPKKLKIGSFTYRIILRRCSGFMVDVDRKEIVIGVQKNSDIHSVFRKLVGCVLYCIFKESGIEVDWKTIRNMQSPIMDIIFNNSFWHTLMGENFGKKNSDYPKRIFIGDDEWRVMFVNEVSGLDDHLGEADPGDSVLKIKKGLSHKEKLSTFVHELLHAFEFSYDYEMSHQTIYDLEMPIIDFLKSAA